MKKLAHLSLIALVSYVSIANAETDKSESSALNVNAISETSQKNQFVNYSGIPGTGIPHKTVSSTGGAVEFTSSGTQGYGFFGQTLSNGIYYEGRLYGRFNYESQNPQFTNVPVSNQNNPLGYGAVFKLGYDFKPTNLIDIIPYLRLNALNDMSVAYSDTNGDSISSITYAVLPGVKLAYKVTPEFNPYIDFYGGWQQVNLSANFASASAKTDYKPGSYTSTINQTTLTYEIGFSSKVTKNLSVIPYMQYSTTSNSSDPNINAIDNAGFNYNSQTSTSQAFGLKVSYAW